jgi:hypothetical protein
MGVPGVQLSVQISRVGQVQNNNLLKLYHKNTVCKFKRPDPKQEEEEEEEESKSFGCVDST